MKDTYQYQKTLRNYDDDNNNNSNKLKLNKKNNISLTKSQKSISYSTYKPSYNNKMTQQQVHNVDQYCILTDPSKFQLKQLKNNKKGKNKTKKSQSHLSLALKQHLKKPQYIMQTQIGPNNIVHCRSLQKLQIISNDRSSQIKKLMQQKGILYSQNQQLKAKLNNPTFRQQQYIQKIVEKQLEIQNLNHSLKRKQERIFQIQKQYKNQIQRLKIKHRQQITTLKEEINQIKYANSKANVTFSKNIIKEDNHSGNSLYNKPVTKTYQSSQNNYKGVSSYQPINSSKVQSNNKAYTTSNTITYKAPQTLYTTISPNQTNQKDYQKRTVHSTNYSQYLGNTNYNNVDSNKLSKQAHQKNVKISSPKNNNEGNNKVQTYKNDTISTQKQSYKTYVGQDGYERRIYYKQGQQQKNQAPKTSSSYKFQSTISPQITTSKNSYTGNSINNLSNQQPYTYAKTYTSQNQKNVRFTNQKILTTLNPIQQNQTQSHLSKYAGSYRYGDKSNQNMYTQKQVYYNKHDNKTNLNAGISFGGDTQNFYNNSLTFQIFDKLS